MRNATRHRVGIADRNLRLSVIFQVSQYAPLYWPYMFHLVTHVRGLSGGEFGALKALYYLTAAAFEFPSGVLADRLGRRGILLVGALLNALACGLYTKASSFGTFALAEVAFGLATASITGAGPALLFESYQAESREAEFARGQGRCVAAGMLATTLGLPLTDLFLVRDGDPVLAYAASGWLSLIGVGAALAMHEPPVVRARSARRIAAGALGDALRVPEIGRALLLSASVFVLMRSANALVFDPVLEAAGLPVDTYGTVLALVGLVGTASAWRAHRWIERFGDRATLSTLPFSLVGMYGLLMVITGPGAVLLLGTQGVAAGTLPVVVQTYLNRVIPSAERRATVLSLESLLSRACYGVAAVLIGGALDVWALPGALWITMAAGVVPLLASLLLQALRTPSVGSEPAALHAETPVQPEE